jgi:hypothetical protein
VLCCINSELPNKINKTTNKINKITYKTDKNANIFVILLILFVVLLILFVNSLLKPQTTQLPAMKAVIKLENNLLLLFLFFPQNLKRKMILIFNSIFIYSTYKKEIIYDNIKSNLYFIYKIFKKQKNL